MEKRRRLNKHGSSQERVGRPKVCTCTWLVENKETIANSGTLQSEVDIIRHLQGIAYAKQDAIGTLRSIMVLRVPT
jgi:hypothetical protein